jgi:hypothetical protein
VCNGCKSEAIFCFIEHESGRTPAEIRGEMEKGEAWKLSIDEQTEKFFPLLQRGKHRREVGSKTRSHSDCLHGRERTVQRTLHLGELKRPKIQPLAGLNIRQARKERKMKYDKPELIVLPDPINSIHNHTAKPCSSIDNAGGQNATSSAYEADE